MRRRVLAVVALQALLAVAAARAEHRPAVYYKLMKAEDALALERAIVAGERGLVEPRFARSGGPRELRTQIERLMESYRRRAVASGRLPAEAASRWNSIFALNDPKLGAQWEELAGARVLVRLGALGPGVGTYDARYYEDAYYAFEELAELAGRARNGPAATTAEAARRSQRLRELATLVRRGAEAYWTAPATGPRARPDARPETLLPGGALYLGREEAHPEPRRVAPLEKLAQALRGLAR
ncbi:MAG: hypothetical protein IT371_27900 [Deltaproteobacteria bacterium]|nr:hypothetical protein [Deltaproteobacteria bacterium]